MEFAKSLSPQPPQYWVIAEKLLEKLPVNNFLMASIHVNYD